MIHLNMQRGSSNQVPEGGTGIAKPWQQPHTAGQASPAQLKRFTVKLNGTKHQNRSKLRPP